MHISFREWIVNSIADIGREIAPTDIFQPTLHNVFLKTLAGRQWFFFSAEVVFLFWCCIRNVQCRSARFYCASSTDVFFRPKLSSSHLFGKKTLAHLGKKIFFTILIEKNDSRRRPEKMTDRGLKKKHHRMTPIEHLLTDIMHISLRDWIENSIADIGREVSPTDIFQTTLRNFF